MHVRRSPARARTPRLRLVALLVLLSGSLLLWGLDWLRTQGPPSVLLVVVDTLRPDYLSANGYPLPTSPYLDRLVGSGYYFEQAVAPMARTTPSVASLLSGAYPHTTGVRSLTRNLSPDVKTLAEVFRGWGYRTVAVVTNGVLKRERGLDRGFDLYDVAHSSRDAVRTTDAALRAFADADPADPFFAWVHYIEPHVPYHPSPEIAEGFDPGYEGRYRLHFGFLSRPGRPEPYRSYPEDLPKPDAVFRNRLPARVNEHVRRLYAGDVRMVDGQVERLVESLRAWSRRELLVVFTADHGESLGEHDFYFDHGDYVYNAATRVPLAFVLPESHPLSGAGRCHGWVSLVDVVPTLAELLGRELPPAMAAQLEGRSLVACLRGKPLEPRPVFAESGHPLFPELVPRRAGDVAGRFQAVILGDFKLIRTPGPSDASGWELYDLASDPLETRNLYRPDHPRVPELAARLREWLARGGAGESAPAAISAEDQQTLKALGYL